jgi:hypothetical protein
MSVKQMKEAELRRQAELAARGWKSSTDEGEREE